MTRSQKINILAAARYRHLPLLAQAMILTIGEFHGVVAAIDAIKSWSASAGEER